MRHSPNKKTIYINWNFEFSYMKKIYWVIIVIALIVIIASSSVLIIGIYLNIYYSSRAYPEEFNELNKCQTDIECVVGQEDVGTDIPSPEPQCVTKAVIDRFDNWFESKNQVVSNIICSCDLATNSCNTTWKGR
jgi:hypothetical protein